MIALVDGSYIPDDPQDGGRGKSPRPASLPCACPLAPSHSAPQKPDVLRVADVAARLQIEKSTLSKLMEAHPFFRSVRRGCWPPQQVEVMAAFMCGLLTTEEADAAWERRRSSLRRQIMGEALPADGQRRRRPPTPAPEAPPRRAMPFPGRREA